jgi:hypothetical protein
MRCNVFYVDPLTGRESLNNVRDTDELAQDNGLSDEQADAMEEELRTKGEYRWGTRALGFVARPAR